MFELIKNYRSKKRYLIWVLGGLIFLVLLFSIVSVLNQKVALISPTSGQTDVDLKTNIRVVFKNPIDPSLLRIEFNPQIEFENRFEEGNKVVLLSPRYSLTPGTRYQIRITEPFSYTSYFTTLFLPLDQQQGQNYNYNKEFNELSPNDKKLREEWSTILNFRKLLPYKNNFFSVRYVVATDKYIVNLLDTNREKAKTEFLSWLKGHGLSEELVKVVYVNGETADFAITSIAGNTDQVHLTSSIKITFSNPLDVEKLFIRVIPETPVNFDVDRGLTVVTVSPEQAWTYNTDYKIIISGETADQNGTTLQKEYVVDFKTEPLGGI